MSTEVTFTQTDCGDYTKAPADAPEGFWQALVKNVKKMKTKKDGCPMLCVEWTLSEAESEDNTAFEGARVSDFLIFWPATHPQKGNAVKKLKAMCAATGVSLPEDLSSLKDGKWDSLQDFIDELTGATGRIKTWHQADKQTGDIRCQVDYPSRNGQSVAPPPDSDDDVKPAKKAVKKGTKAKA